MNILIDANIIYESKINLLEEVEKVKSYSILKYGIKRVCDMLIILLLLPIVIPLSLYSIFRIRKESKGSILFKQNRVGINGKVFTCYKFRSMHNNMPFNPYTQDNDPRIFAYGNVMRKYRIDELPQMLNILKGEMHLVGPRAEWDILVEKYTGKIDNYEKRHLVKPGITGLAQVSYPYGRNTSDAKEKLKYDLFYIKNWSIFMELKVMLQTVLVVLGKRGV